MVGEPLHPPATAVNNGHPCVRRQNYPLSASLVAAIGTTVCSVATHDVTRTKKHQARLSGPINLPTLLKRN